MNQQQTAPNVDAIQVADGAWYGVYFWHGEWRDCDEGFATREEAEADARAMLDYLNSHPMEDSTNE